MIQTHSRYKRHRAPPARYMSLNESAADYTREPLLVTKSSVLGRRTETRKAADVNASDGHWKIKRRAFFLHIGRTEIDHDLLVRRTETVVADRGKNTVSGFAHRRIRQSNDDDLTVSTGRDVHFDI